MQKTGQSLSTNYSSRVDKHLEQKVGVSTQRKPQYLDVALQQSVDNDKKGYYSKNTNGKINAKENKQSAVVGSKGKSKFSDFSGVKNTTDVGKNTASVGKNTVSGVKNSAGNNFNKGNVSERNKKVGLPGTTGGKSETEDNTKKVTGLGSPTFQEKSKFKNVQNQKLFQELDSMLTGKHGIEVPEKTEPMTSRSQKTEKITVLNNKTYFQPSRDAKKSGYTAVPPLHQNGLVDPESKIFHTRELRAKERIETIDSFRSGDSKAKLGTLSKNSPGNVSSRLNTQRDPQASQGVPVNPGNVTTRHHYIADIPIYLPSFDGSSPSVGQAFPAKTQQGNDRVIQATANITHVTAGVNQPEPYKKLAPEIFSGPVPELSNLTNTPVPNPNNTYRQQANPVRQRLFEEQSKKFERDNLKFFDVEPKNGQGFNPVTAARSRSPLPTYRSARDYDGDETMHSDPGSVNRSRLMDDLSKYKYSPEGFLAEKSRLEREGKRSSRDFVEDFRRREPGGQGPIDRREWRRPPVPTDNSWVRADRPTPNNVDTYRKPAMRADDKSYGDSTYRVKDGSTYRRVRSNSPQPSVERDKDTHRTYQIPSDMRDRERYTEHEIREERFRQSQKNKDYYDSLKSDRDTVRNANGHREWESRNQTDRGSFAEDRYARDRDIRDRDTRDRDIRDRDIRDRDTRDRDIRDRDTRDRGTRDRDLRDRDIDKHHDSYGRHNRRHDDENRERVDQIFESDAQEFKQYMEEKFRDERTPGLGDGKSDNSFNSKKDDYSFEKRSDLGYASDRSGRNGNKDLTTVAGRERGSLYDKPSFHSDTNDKYYSERTEETVRQESYSRYERPSAQKAEQPGGSASRKRKFSAERVETRTKSGDLKVEYVLRNKSSSTDMLKQDKDREGSREPPAKEVEKREQPQKPDRKSYEDKRGPDTWRGVSPSHDRNKYPEIEKREPSSEKGDPVRQPAPPTYETKLMKEDSKHGDDFTKYFDDPDNVNSPSKQIPFYSDNSSRYAKDKYEFNMPGGMMTPVQEISMRQSEESDKDHSKGERNKTPDRPGDKGLYNSSYADDITDRKPIQEKEVHFKVTEPDTEPRNQDVDDNNKGSAKSERGNPRFLSSTVNKHDIKEDRKSPWRKEEDPPQGQASPRQEFKPHPTGPDFSDVNVGKRSDSFERIKAEVRQKTEEKLQKKREKTMDSQGPTLDDSKIEYPDFENKKESEIEEEQPPEVMASWSSVKDDPSEIHKQQSKDKSNDRDTLIDQLKKPSDEANKLADSGGLKNMDKPGDRTGDKEKAEGEEIDIDDLNLDEVETEMDGRELYVCYLMTDDGEAIGPLKLDIDDVQIGLPKPPAEGDKKQDGDRKDKGEDTEGMRNRQTGSHGLNEFSSRSHSMLMLTIDSEQQDPEDENIYITKRGKLTFVDLAGSEKVKDSNSTADTLVESNSINKSLLVLGNCISSLGDHKRRQGHIPYRDSKLTKLLADSLGGNGVTLMICCITPSSHHAPETMNTLRYASRAKKIRTKPVVKMDPREKLILTLKREVKVLRNENHYLREQLEFPAKPRGQLQKENDQKFMKMMKEANGKPAPTPAQTNNTSTVVNTNEKMKQNGGSAEEGGLYEMLQEYMVENETLRTENADMQVQRDKIRQEQQLLYRDNEKLMKRVDELERRMNQAQTSWQSMPRQGSHQDHQQARSRDHSPMGSPHYIRAGGSGGRGPPPNRLPPHPNDLPLKDNPALRDPVYPGSPPQGYNSPTGNGKGKQAARGQPKKPPHRLVEPIGQQRPVHEQNGPPVNGPYMNGHPAQFSPGHPGGHPHGHPGGHPAGHPASHPAGHPGSHPAGHPGSHPTMQYRQPPPIGSPNRTAADLRMDSRRSSQSSSSDAIKDMNERLKAELMQLEGEIHHQTALNHRNVYGSQGSMR